MNFDLIVIFGLLATCAIAVYSLYRTSQGSIEYMPSLGWAFLMAFPFIIEFPLFYPETRGLHAYAVMGFLALMFATDYTADHKISNKQTRDDTQCSLRLAYMLAAAYFALTVFHYVTVNSIPLFDMLASDKSKSTILDGRIDFSRNYEGIPGLKYLFNLSTAVLGLPAVLLLWRNKKYVPAILMLGWVLVYCAASTAKGPLILVIMMSALGLIYMSPLRARIAVARVFLILSFITVAAIGGITLNPTHHKTVFTIFSNVSAKYSQPEILREDRTKLLGDYVRPRLDLPVDGCMSVVCRQANYLAYRIFLTPIEVSARWYEYFTAYPLKEIHLKRYVHDTRLDREMHPAQAVGIWAFAETFPEIYSNQVYAYPSMDADAFGRFGVLGLMALMFVYTLIRISAAWLRDIHAYTHGVYYAITIALLAYTPSNAGMQAILVAHGLATTLIVLFGIRYLKERSIFALLKHP